jgi:hypothetical protein
MKMIARIAQAVACVLAAESSDAAQGGPGWGRQRRRPVYQWSKAVFLMLALAGGTLATGQTTLLNDDFNDNQIDAATWSVVTAGVPFSGAEVVEQGQVMMLKNRGHLVTVEEWGPAVVGGLMITGRGTFASSDGDWNRFSALTRADGIPSGSYGETANGIDFHFHGSASGPMAGQVNIVSRGNLVDISDAVRTGTIVTWPGTIFDFEVIDDGIQLSFKVWEVGNPANTASAVATVLSDATI